MYRERERVVIINDNNNDNNDNDNDLPDGGQRRLTFVLKQNNTTSVKQEIVNRQGRHTTSVKQQISLYLSKKDARPR